MRNWNCPAASYPKVSRIVFTVPEELKLCADGNKFQFGGVFYSTYEELKQFFHKSNKSAFLRFYSTYEELKPTCKLLAISIPPSFYSTYEELKPV